MTARFAPRKLMDIELSRPLDAILRPEPPYGGVFLTAWLAGRPLAVLDLAPSDLPLPKAALAELLAERLMPVVGELLYGPAFALRPARGEAGQSRITLEVLTALLGERAFLPAATEAIAAQGALEGEGRVSLIVCTRNRPELLARLLASLESLRPPPDEVIVVDNAPSDERTREVTARFPFVRYLRESRAGLSAARNRGIAAARCELLAFTDDDASVAHDWLAALKRAFIDPEIMAVTGLMLPSELETVAQVVFQSDRNADDRLMRLQPVTFDADFFASWQGRAVPCWKLGAGANMAFRRSVFAEVGLFDERLGAGAAGCSEDSELWYRLLAAGYRCRYEPAAIVRHQHRRSTEELRRQSYEYMRGHVAALLVQAAEHRHLGNLRRVFLTLPGHFALQTVVGLAAGFDAHRRLLPWQIAGSLAGLITWLGLFWRRKHRALAELEAQAAKSR